MKSVPTYTNNYFGELRGFNKTDIAEGYNAYTVLGSVNYDRRIYDFYIYNTPNNTPTFSDISFIVLIAGPGNNFSGGTGYRMFTKKIKNFDVVNVVRDDVSSSFFQRKKDKAGCYYFDLPKGWSLGVDMSTSGLESQISKIRCRTFVSGEII